MGGHIAMTVIFTHVNLPNFPTLQYVNCCLEIWHDLGLCFLDCFCVYWYTSIHAMYSYVVQCSCTVSTASYWCASIYQDTQVYPRIHKYTHQYTQVFTGIHQYTQVYTGIHRYTPVHTGIHQYTQVYTSIHRYVSLCVGGSKGKAGIQI